MIHVSEGVSAVSESAPESLREALREALAWYPSGVAVVTTADADGTWRGFTASSFCSLSADPPLVLVCLARSAQCHGAFLVAEQWAVHALGHDQTGLARSFASHDRTKFQEWPFELSSSGNPVLSESSMVLECRRERTYEGGDHTILIGRVESVRHGHQPPAVYFRQGFHRLSPVDTVDTGDTVDDEPHVNLRTDGQRALAIGAQCSPWGDDRGLARHALQDVATS